MPKSTTAVNLDLEDLLTSKGYDVTSLDSSGKQLPTSTSADVQTFHFHRDGKDYGTVTVSIDGLKNMIVYYDDEIANSGVNEDDMDGDRGMNGTSWISLVKQLKKFAQRHQLGFVLKDSDRLRTDMKRRSQNDQELKEGAQLKRVKREYNVAAKNKGGDFDGSGKKIDNMKKSIRQKDIGKDKTVTEGSNDYFKRRKNEEDRIAGTKPPAKRKPGNTGNTDYQRRRNREKEIGEGVTEGKEELHTQLKSINQKLKLMRGGPVGEPNSMAFVEKRKELLKQKEQILSQLKQDMAEGSIEEALQEPPTSTGNELLDEFIGMYVKNGWKYHGTNKLGGHEFRKRRYMPAALYGLKDGGVIESHNNGTRVSRFDSSGKRVAKLAHGPLSEQGVAEGIGGDMAKLIGIPVVAGAAAIGAQYYDGQQPHVQVGGQNAKIVRADSNRIPDNAMIITGKDGKQYRVWQQSGKGMSKITFAAPVQGTNEGVAEGLSKRDQKDVDAIKAAIERLQAQLKQPNADKESIQQSIAHEKKRLGLYGKDTQQKLDEGYYGNRKMSYSDDTPQVKMIIKHNRQLEETDKRFRHIEKIFLETSDGERFGVPTNKPSRARMFARHIAEGGGYKDERWNHIAEINEDIDSLGGFIRATRSGDQFNESAQRMIGEAVDKYHELRETAKRLQGVRGYNSYFEAYQPAVKNDNDDDLLEVFKHSSVDSRIEKALPTLNKLGIRRGKLEEADMFEQWADSLIDESLDIDGDRQSEAIIELFADELPVGPNAEVAIGELADVIEDDDLYARLRRTAAVNPNSDARPQIIAWMQEQEGPEYRELLAKLETENDDSAEDQEELKKSDKSDSIEPAKVQPKKKKPDSGDMGGLPSGPGGDMGGGLPPLPPLPPLKEGDDTLADIKRLLGL